MRGLALLPALAISALLPAAADVGPEIPRPALAEMEAHVQRQLRDAREELDGLVADPETAPAPLAAALGLMGQLYHAYDLTEPAEACYERAAELSPDDYRWHYYLGLLRQRGGRREESIAALEQALEVAPDDAATLLRLADQARAGDRLDRAGQLYRRLLDQAPSEAAALRGLAQIATARGEHAEAASLLERALASQPSATRLHYLLAIAYRRLGEMDKARQQIALQGPADIASPDPLLAELSSLASGSAVSLQRGYYAAFAGFNKTAIEDYRRAVAAAPGNPEARRSLAGALAESGDHAGAIEQLRELLRIDPDSAGAHFTLAERLNTTGATEEALSHYQTAVEQAPDFRSFRLALARALIRAGHLADSAPHLRRLIEIDQHDTAARIDLGELLLAQGQTEAAAAQFRLVLAGDSAEGQRAAAHTGLGRMLAGSGAVEEAIEEFEAALGLAPEFRPAHLGLASLLGRSGRFAEAAGAFRRALELEPRDRRARLGEATALLLSGDAPAAVERLEEGVALLPESDELEDTLARLLAAAPDDSLRDGPRALTIAEVLFGRRPTLRHAETLAMALAETGRFEEAVEWQERVVAEATRQQDTAVLAGAEQTLSAYRRGEPYRLR
jgi:tetratricopeptide (TPR) repeat protein